MAAAKGGKQKHVCHLPPCCDTKFKLEGWGSEIPEEKMSMKEAKRMWRDNQIVLSRVHQTPPGHNISTSIGAS